MPYEEYQEVEWKTREIDVSCDESSCDCNENGACTVNENVECLCPDDGRACLHYSTQTNAEWNGIYNEEDVTKVKGFFEDDIPYSELDPLATRIRLVTICCGKRWHKGLFRVSKERQEDFFYFPTAEGVEAVHGLIADADIFEPGRHAKLQAST